MRVVALICIMLEIDHDLIKEIKNDGYTQNVLQSHLANSSASWST